MHIVTDWVVARKQICKHIPMNSHPTIEGRPLLGNRLVTIHRTNDCATIDCFLWGPRREVIVKTTDAAEVS
jgi:hypothetical protein